METPGTDWATSAVIVRTRTERTMEMYRRTHHLVQIIILVGPGVQRGCPRSLYCRVRTHFPPLAQTRVNLKVYEFALSLNASNRKEVEPGRHAGAAGLVGHEWNTSN